MMADEVVALAALKSRSLHDVYARPVMREHIKVSREEIVHRRMQIARDG